MISTALSKAQGSLEPAELNATNTFIGSSYADLTSVVDAIREPLAENGLAISQAFIPSSDAYGNDGTLLSTTLLHESGQFLRGFLPLLNVTDWHSLGSAISYARRYSINSMVGVAPKGSDDDGETAMGRGSSPPKPKRKTRTRKAPAKEVEITTTEPPKDLVAEVKKIISKVDGGEEYLRGIGVDPGDPPANIREKILALGSKGLAMKIFEQRKKEETEAIIDEAEKVKPIKLEGFDEKEEA